MACPPTLEELAVRPPVRAVHGRVVIKGQLFRVPAQLVLLVPHRHECVAAVVVQGLVWGRLVGALQERDQAPAVQDAVGWEGCPGHVGDGGEHVHGADD